MFPKHGVYTTLLVLITCDCNMCYSASHPWWLVWSQTSEDVSAPELVNKKEEPRKHLILAPGLAPWLRLAQTALCTQMVLMTDIHGAGRTHSPMTCAVPSLRAWHWPGGDRYDREGPLSCWRVFVSLFLFCLPPRENKPLVAPGTPVHPNTGELSSEEALYISNAVILE